MKTVGTTTHDHLRLHKWAVGLAEERLWAIEDCRHLTRRLERDLIAAGETVVRVSPKLMAHVRDSARSYGKSDPIDALAVARAALREPNLPTARLDGVERELRLLVDHREDLVGERTRIISRLRWHLHELDPGWTPPTKLQRGSAFDKVQAHLSRRDDGAIVRRLALGLVEHLRLLTDEIDELTAEITVRVTRIAPSLLAIVGCGALSAEKIIGETAHAGRFRSKDAYARHNGTAPLPVWSSNKQRHRLSRTGNRRKRQRRLARARAQHDVAHAATNQFVDHDAGLRRRWVHHYSVSHRTQLARLRRRRPGSSGDVAEVLLGTQMSVG